MAITEKQKVELLLEELETQIATSQTSTQDEIARQGIKWIITLLKKNHDYGNSAFKSPVLCEDLPPTTSILVRMSDKIERIRSLTTKEAQVDESLEDTFKDLGAYCLLYLVAKSETKK